MFKYSPGCLYTLTAILLTCINKNGKLKKLKFLFNRKILLIIHSALFKRTSRGWTQKVALDTSAVQVYSVIKKFHGCSCS